MRVVGGRGRSDGSDWLDSESLLRRGSVAVSGLLLELSVRPRSLAADRDLRRVNRLFVVSARCRRGIVRFGTVSELLRITSIVSRI